MRGKLIVFEGLNGCGKTHHRDGTVSWLTQSPLFSELKQANQIKGVYLTKEPGGTKAGRTIRQMLLGDEPLGNKTELLLYLADRAEHVQRVIRPAIEDGYLVFCDRYWHSTLAFQGYGRGHETMFLQAMHDFLANGLEPDLAFLLDLPPEEGLARATKHSKADRLEREPLDFHERAREGYLEIARQSPETVFTVDSTQPKEVVRQIIVKELQSRLSQWCRTTADTGGIHQGSGGM